MITFNEQEMSKSICETCDNYMFLPDDTYGTWCMHFKDIYNAILNEQIITVHNNEPIDRSIHYNLHGIVYCEGYKPK